MKINLITYSSEIEKSNNITRVHEKTLAELEIQFDVNYCRQTELDNINKEELSIIFIASGGVEQLIAHDIEKNYPAPLFYLLMACKIR